MIPFLNTSRAFSLLEQVGVCRTIPSLLSQQNVEFTPAVVSDQAFFSPVMVSDISIWISEPWMSVRRLQPHGEGELRETRWWWSQPSLTDRPKSHTNDELSRSGVYGVPDEQAKSTLSAKQSSWVHLRSRKPGKAAWTDGCDVMRNNWNFRLEVKAYNAWWHACSDSTLCALRCPACSLTIVVVLPSSQPRDPI
jgi:hypothetical protein